MNQDLLEWILMLLRWLHITVAITWIGTSIFFMWLDRSFEKNPNSTNPGHIGDLWMVHGGGFYHVEKLEMGKTRVPARLHWFKWESYWTWMSGMALMTMIFYIGDGTFLLDSTVSNITYFQGVLLALFSIFGSWFFYDFVWELNLTKEKPIFGHILTLVWFTLMTYLLCQTLSGRAAYIHVGGMLGTWMTANVFMRIIPRQILMVEATAKGEPVNSYWSKNAKNRSTHNTYFTLPIIFIMLSNHFPGTYGHDYNWLILLGLSAAGAAIREYFVVRLNHPKRSIIFGLIGIVLISIVGVTSSVKTNQENNTIQQQTQKIESSQSIESDPQATVDVAVSEKIQNNVVAKKIDIEGVILFTGEIPKAKKLTLPAPCAKQFKTDVYSNEALVKNQKLQNALVRVIKGHEAHSYPPVPETEVELDQKGCIYTPRVIAARVGQKVTFINSDPLFHNVKSVTQNNERFNVAMPHKGQRITKIFNKPEISLQAKCSVHPWMGAHVAILDHPYFSVTNEDGNFKISQLPIGKYTIQVWHEVFGTKDFEIDTTSGVAEKIEIDLNQGGKND
jgi:uncharacterized membrane protein/plastocyanin